MIDCLISTEDETAYLDLRAECFEFVDAERLLEALQPYIESGRVSRAVVDVRCHEPLPAPVEILLMGLHAQARCVGAAVEVRSGPLPLLATAS